MEFIFELVQVFVCILEACLMFDFFSAFFVLRKIFCNKYWKAVIILGTAGCVLLVNAIHSSAVNMIGMFVIYAVMIFSFFKGYILKKIYYLVMAIAILTGSEFLTLILLSRPSDLFLSQVRSNMISMVFFMLCMKLVSFVLFMLIKWLHAEPENKMDIKNLLLYSVVPVSTLGIMVSLAYSYIDYEIMVFEDLLILSSVLVIVGNILSFYVFNRYSGTIGKLRQQELIITKLEMEEKRFQQIEQVNQEHAGFLHDVRHYMKVIGELALENNNEEILKMVSELQVKVSNTESEMLCQNKLLNAILNERKKEAEDKNVLIKIIIEPEFTVEHITNMDLIVIMGNLLDNAIEAASRCLAGHVRVYLFAQNDGHFSVIKIVNNYTGEINWKDDTIITSKKEKSRHGFGIQNVSDAAVRYGGFLNYFYENGVFTAIVILPIADII